MGSVCVYPPTTDSSSKIGAFEKSCVTQCLTVAVPLIVALMKAGKHVEALPVLVMVFNKKKTFYKDLRTSAMIGSYWNKVPGSPEVRAQCIEAFCEMKGFQLLLGTLEHMVQSHREDEELEAVIDSEDIRTLLQALLEFRASVPDDICSKICVLIMTYFTKIPSSVLKKESSDAVGAVLAIIRRLVDAGIVESEEINKLWLEITQRYVESTSLPLRLFGLEQINQIVNCAQASRSYPPRYFVRNAGTEIVNGVYTLKPDATNATYVLKRDETGQVFTLFCCTMKSGLKWWFISEADKMQPGSDQDIDYYQHQSQYEEYLPPTHNWVAIGKGEAPAPELVADTVQAAGEEDHSRLDYLLSSWVTSKRIIEEIFGDRIHREIVSRSALLVKFLAESNKLDAHCLDVIWQSCIQKDQTLVNEIHNLLITTVPFLSIELLLHLVKSIHDSLLQNLRRSEPFPELIAFLQRLATNSPSFLMDRSAEVTTAILQLLWSIQMHCNIANFRLSRGLRDFFQEGLRSEYGEPLRKLFLSECIDGIKRSCFLDKTSSPKSNGNGSPAGAEPFESDATASKSLELLKFLIDSYRLDQGEVVESLNSEHGLVALLFDELAAFVARSNDKQSTTYRTAIGHRLELIHYVHFKSPNLELSIPQIDRLWKILSSSPAEREFCLVFFNQTSMRGNHQQTTMGSTSMLPSSASISSAFSLEVCAYIFNKLLCLQTDFKTLGTSGYKCFNTYFAALNAQQKNTEAPLSLLGLDALWQIAFEAPMDVSDLATRELLRVYERYSDDPSTSEADVEATLKDFLKRVFEQLSKVHECKSDSLKLVRHCSSLLVGLVSSSRRKQPSFVPHGLSGRGAYFSVKLIAQRIPGSSGVGNAVGGAHQDNSIRTLQTSVYSNQSLWLFRRQLEKVVGHPMQQTKILMAGSAVTGDQKTLADLHITESSELRVLMFNTIVQRGATSPIEHSTQHLNFSAKKDVLHPGEIISNDTTYFDVLFRVLDTVEGHDVHEVLWEFLKKIPTSVELLDRVANIGGPSAPPLPSSDDDDVTMTTPSADDPPTTNAGWSSLLRSGASYHEAIYTLQIMDALLLPSDAKKIPFARAYLQRFISGGGFHEVLSYFIGANFHASSFNEGPAVALRILKFCLFDSEHSDVMLATVSDDDVAVEAAAPVAGDEGSGASEAVSKSKIVVEHSRYDDLVLKIAELVVSEFGRAEETLDRKPTLRILIEAVKTVESIVAIAPDAAEKYMSSVALRPLVVAILLKIESDHVRAQWLSSLRSVCRASASAAQAIYSEFIASIDRIEEITVPCDQYASMLVFLAQLDGMTEECRALAQRVVLKFRRGFSSKFIACNEHSNEVLVGLLEFLREVIVSHAEVRAAIAREVVDVVYEECLFTLPNEERRRCPLCVSIETRRPAFKLLASAISSDSTILHDLHGRLPRLFTRSEELRNKWGQENNIKTRGNGEHVGLKNQGCSCYMNSFLQQLFMHPTIRQGLLAAKVSPRSTPTEPTKAEAEQFPERLVGCRVAVECLGGRVYEANVVGYDSATRHHTLRYEDGREASFVLAEGRPGNENGRYVILQPELVGIDATLEVLRQVQRTFCYLRDSEMRYFNPKALVDSCTCLNLEFSVYQQNDASEFCDKLLDRLETGLKTTPQGTRCLQEAIGGKLISQKLPKGCDHRYEREEPFIRLELQIRGKESIEESLAAFVEGEVMDGDNKVECESCGTKKAAVRRTCFGTLPNLLILHLKRFDLDYTTFETVKLNNRCSFPMNLMMKPYTKAGIEEQEATSVCESTSPDDEDMESDASSGSDEFMPDVNGAANDTDDDLAAVKPDSPRSNSSNSSASSVNAHAGDDNDSPDGVISVDAADVGAGGASKANRKHSHGSKDSAASSDPDYEYRLKGILVHSGVAQGGHYYSFIYDHVSEKWFKFDDEDVTPFDPANIEAECFGGVQRRSWHGSSNAMEMEVFSNALMLFYEKVVPAHVEVTTEGAASESMTDVSSYEGERCDYEAEVWKANEVFLQNSYLFDVEFHEFLREMVQSKYMKDSSSLPSPPLSPSGDSAMVPAPGSPGVDESLQATLADIGVEFVLGVLLHSREKHGIARWITVLAAKFAKHKSICARFFRTLATTKRSDWLRSLLFECPDSIARQSFVHLVSRALTAYDAHMVKDGSATVDSEDAQVLTLLSQALAEFLDQTSVAQQSHLEECFMLLRNCAEISSVMRALFQQQEMVARLVGFFLSERAPAALKEAFPTSHAPSGSSALTASAVAAATHRYASPDYQYLLEAIIAILGLPRRSTEPLLAESSAQYPHRVALSDKAEAALTEVFNDYQSAENGLGVDELMKFLRASTSSVGTSNALEQNARAFLAKYGNREAIPPRVELDGFLTYYTDAAAASTKNVLQDLRAFGFGEDLRRHSKSLPPASSVLGGLSPLSRSALLNDVFMDSALEEDAETVGDFMLRISIGDAATSEMLTRSLLQCMNGAESGWKGQPVVDVCALALQNLLAYEFPYQSHLIELALLAPEFGLLSTAQTRARFGNGSANLTTATHVALFVYRQLSIVLELHSKVPSVATWLAEHASAWEWLYEWLRIESLKPSLGGRMSVLTREPAKLDVLLRLGEALGVAFREEERCYLVEGAGYANVNGIYKSTTHTHDNCLTYACIKGDIEYTLFRCCMPSKARRWYISYSPNKNLLGTMSDEDFYFVQSHVDHELPPEDGWKVWVKNDKAQPPVPTVRLYSSTVGASGGRGEGGEMELDAHGNVAIQSIDEEFADVDGGVDVDGDADADTVEYDDSEDEIRVSNERFQAVHLDNQEDGEPSSGPDDFM